MSDHRNRNLFGKYSTGSSSSGSSGSGSFHSTGGYKAAFVSSMDSKSLSSMSTDSSDSGQGANDSRWSKSTTASFRSEIMDNRIVAERQVKTSTIQKGDKYTAKIETIYGTRATAYKMPATHAPNEFYSTNRIFNQDFRHHQRPVQPIDLSKSFKQIVNDTKESDEKTNPLKQADDYFFHNWKHPSINPSPKHQPNKLDQVSKNNSIRSSSSSTSGFVSKAKSVQTTPAATTQKSSASNGFESAIMRSMANESPSSATPMPRMSTINQPKTTSSSSSTVRKLIQPSTPSIEHDPEVAKQKVNNFINKLNERKQNDSNANSKYSIHSLMEMVTKDQPVKYSNVKFEDFNKMTVLNEMKGHFIPKKRNIPFSPPRNMQPNDSTPKQSLITETFRNIDSTNLSNQFPIVKKPKIDDTEKSKANSIDTNQNGSELMSSNNPNLNQVNLNTPINSNVCPSTDPKRSAKKAKTPTLAIKNSNNKNSLTKSTKKKKVVFDAKQRKISDFFFKLSDKKSNGQNVIVSTTTNDNGSNDYSMENEETFDNLSQELASLNFNPNHSLANNLETSNQSTCTDQNVDGDLFQADQKLKKIRQQLKHRFLEVRTEPEEEPKIPQNEDELLELITNPQVSKYFKTEIINKHFSYLFADNESNQLYEVPLESVSNAQSKLDSLNNQFGPIEDVQEFQFEQLSDDDDCEIVGSVISNPEANPFCDLPANFVPLFKEFVCFNDFQKLVFDDLIKSDVSLAISAPTGCGKTVAFELAIIKMLMNGANVRPSIVMISPLKSICKEKLNLWNSKFNAYNYNCIEITGDSEFEEIITLQNFNILITTPEKFDSLSRKLSFLKYLTKIKLFLIDEIHTIGDELRGPILETLIVRLKLFNENNENKVRFITLSATIPNVKDISDWISNSSNDCKYVELGEETRPVKIETVVLGFDAPSSANDFAFDKILTQKLNSVINKYSKRRPTLIFAPTRKICQETAEALSSQSFVYNLEMRQQLNKIIARIGTEKLKTVLKAGVAYHHAGVPVKDRDCIHESFKNGLIPVLISTSTLALGVNLPAHLVIIKGTFQYVNGTCQLYDENQILQMIGRAGRPQFDTEATAVIMTKSSLKEKFEQYINSSKIIESQLHRAFAESLNTEIFLGLIQNVQAAYTWIKASFLYVRLAQNPQHYQFAENWSRSRLEDHLQNSIDSELKLLVKHNLIQIDSHDKICSTKIGQIMAEYYISLDTIKRFFEVKKPLNLESVLELICDSAELIQETQIRNIDKPMLNKLNFVDRKAKVFGLRFPIKGSISTNEKKVNCLLQSFLGCNSLDNSPLYMEANKLIRTATRVSKAFFEYMRITSNKYESVLNALYLCKSLSAGIWENSEHVCKQLPRIGITLSTKLVQTDHKSFESILKRSPGDIEFLLNKSTPFGNSLKSNILDLPNYDLIVTQQTINAGVLKACIDIEVKIKNTARSELFPFHSSILLIGNEDDQLLLCERIPDSFLHSSPNKTAKFTLTVEKVQKGTIHVNLISDRIVGIDKIVNFQPQYQGQRKRLLNMNPDDLYYLQMQFQN